MSSLCERIRDFVRARQGTEGTFDCDLRRMKSPLFAAAAREAERSLPEPTFRKFGETRPERTDALQHFDNPLDASQQSDPGLERPMKASPLWKKR
jgi:hypothetical protein